MRIDELDYDLPDELIAQAPLGERDASRLLLLDAATGAIRHRAMRELPSLIEPSLFVFNDTRVLAARLFGNKKESGGKVELLLVERLSRKGVSEEWRAMSRASKRLAVGGRVVLEDGSLEAIVTAVAGNGFVDVTLSTSRAATASEVIEIVGRMPLPPYVQREATDSDRSRYQTVFAYHPGAIAAPTAGLHFSESLLAALEAAGHRMAYVTLHVGPGTFLPLRVERVEEHSMHAERYVVQPRTVDAVAAARAEGRPIVAVGTTVARTLETVATDDGHIRIERGRTDLFIRPPFNFRVVDRLLTNFHLPRSTLLALVMAFGGERAVREAYAAAVRERYRFYSYGDAMLISSRDTS